jgi:hypothetical protein
MRKLLSYAVALAMLALAVSAGAQTLAPKTPSKKKAPMVHRKSAPSKTSTAKSKSASASARKAPAKTPVKTPLRKPAAARAAHRAVAPQTRGKSAPARGKSKRVTRASWRSRQAAPTPDRYKEIQQALVTKGYLSPEEANGTWGQSSADALKKFQADQNIAGGGKLNSLSLIALGLGPKHDTAAVPKPPDTHPQEGR